MKIVLTGGGTAGHFYPLIAIAEEINTIIEQEKLVKAEIFYIAPTPYDKKMLLDNGITYKKILSGKMRRYFSLLNIVDSFKLGLGILKAIWTVFLIYPDVVISKGGYASVPTVFAARILRIPIMIHESDARPGRGNMWASKFAKRVALSWPEALKYFPKEKTAVTGQPIRKAILRRMSQGAFSYLHLEENVPVLFILGGSQGAQKINNVILDNLPSLVFRYQIIHQAGPNNMEEVKKLSHVVLKNNPHQSRHHVFGYLNTLAMRMSAGAASLVISRAGSTIFEIASWGLPSILIPITESNGDHQRKNAYNYARSGAAVIIEEANLTPHVLISEIERLLDNEEERNKMALKAKEFFKGDAAGIIAKEAIGIARKHER